MLNLEDFKTKYETYTDEELFDIHLNFDGYSTEAQKAFEIVVAEKGGLEAIKKRLEDKSILVKEKLRIQGETGQFFKSGSDIEFIKKMVTSEIFPITEVEMIITARVNELRQEQKDQEINSRTVIGSIIGGLIASVIGGILWGILIVQTHRIFYIFIAGLLILSYTAN